MFASADDLAAMQYIAPFAGCAIGEWFMRHGHDAVVVYDDLTQHAIAYRQMALLLRRPPGREAYPGDIFYVHSRLLERAAQLASGGSLTALPIVQTFGGDLTGYISTNIISITDGQIFLVETLFNSGIKPAIDLNLSVSRVGSSAQFKAMEFVARRVRVIANMHRQYATLSKVGGGEDIAVHVARGERVIEFLKQDVYVTYSLYKQVLGLYALSMRELDKIQPRYVHCFFGFISLKDWLTVLQADKFDPEFTLFYKDKLTMEALCIVWSISGVQALFNKYIKVCASFFAETLQTRAVKEVELLL